MLDKEKELYAWEKKYQELQSKMDLSKLEKKHDRETIAKYHAQEEEFARKDIQLVELKTKFSKHFQEKGFIVEFEAWPRKAWHGCRRK